MQKRTFPARSSDAYLCKLTYRSSHQTRAGRATERREGALRSAREAAQIGTDIGSLPVGVACSPRR
jgi:hypothetical protein